MAVSVRIEDEAFSDRRYDVLASVLGLPDADCARGKMAAVWRQCTQQQTHVLSAELVRVILGEKGPDALVKSTLGEQVGDGIRICGTRGRIEWLAKLRKNARKGGEARSAKRQPKRQPSGSANDINLSAKRDPKPCPPAPAPAPAPAPTSSPVTAPDPAHGIQTGGASPPPGHSDVIAEFDSRYRDAYGTKPTWGPKQGGQIKTLLGKHSATEIIRRIEILFTAPPAFLSGSAVDLDTLVQHFDKLVQPARQLGLSHRGDGLAHAVAVARGEKP